jgi:hypothetical protein
LKFFEKCGQDARFVIFAIRDERTDYLKCGQDARFVILAIMDERTGTN